MEIEDVAPTGGVTPYPFHNIRPRADVESRS